jgi:hypothetical protein
LKTSASSSYSADFFDDIERGSLESAALIVPKMLELIRPRSVLDVGCGRGAWLSAFRRLGILNTIGVDGGYVDTTKLLIPKECFRTIDLSRPFVLPGRHDLAVCLEVAEHLPANMAHLLVKALTAAAPVVMFSAAIPGQGGTNHRNECWPEYWRQLFATEGYEALDPIRKHLWHDHRVKWWYRQNLLVYASEEAVRSSEVLTAEIIGTEGELLPWVHSGILHRLTGVRGVTRELPEIVRRSLRNRVSRRPPG